MTVADKVYLRAEAISVSRGSHHVLHDVSITAESGTVLGILGRNGAGKTTLLRALAGLQPVASGQIKLGDVPVSKLAQRERAKRIAYLAQDGAVAWPIGARELVALGRLPHRPWPQRLDDSDKAAVLRALVATDAMEFAARSMDTLSSGERSRVLLARALAGEPAVLLADEPVATLDPGHQLGVMRMLRSQASEGMVVVVVLHDLSLASRFCDRLALIGEGRVLAIGTPAEVLEDELLARGFGITALRANSDGERFVVPWREVKS